MMKNIALTLFALVALSAFSQAQVASEPPKATKEKKEPAPAVTINNTICNGPACQSCHPFAHAILDAHPILSASYAVVHAVECRRHVVRAVAVRVVTVVRERPRLFGRCRH